MSEPTEPLSSELRQPLPEHATEEERIVPLELEEGSWIGGLGRSAVLWLPSSLRHAS